MEYTIKELADLAGVSTRTLRWYDQKGLLKPYRVNEANYRFYGDDEVKKITANFILSRAGIFSVRY